MAFGRIVEEFKRFCKRIGGHVKTNEYLKSASCILETDDYTRPAIYAHEFAEFVEKWKPEIRREYIDLSVDVVNKLIGGYTESSGIEYDPSDDVYKLYAELYSEFSTEYGDVREDVEPPKVRGEVAGVRYSGHGDVEWNDATWAWMGVGEAVAKVRDLRRLSEEDIEKIMDAVVEKADGLANEALETMIEASREEW